MGRTGAETPPTRTFCLVGHRSCGKTSLADQMLFAAGATRQAGRVDLGTSLLDHLPEERRKRATSSLGFAWIDWKGALLQFIDTPGAAGLAHEPALAASCTDGVVLVISGVDGVQSGTRRAIDDARRLGVPMIAAITRCDRPVDVAMIVEQLQAELGDARAVLVDGWQTASDGSVSAIRPLHEDPSALEALAETVALSDDALLERYLEDLGLPADVVAAGLAEGTRRNRIVPVALVSGHNGLGVTGLLDHVIACLPAPTARKAVWGVDGLGEDVRIDTEGPFVAQVVANALDDEGNLYSIVRVWAGHPPKKGPWVHGESGRSARVQKLYALRGPRTSAPRWDGPGALLATWDPLGARPGDAFTEDERLVLGAPPVPPPMVGMLLQPVGPIPDGKLEEALDRLITMDPALDLTTDEVTLLPIIWGAGQDHLDRAIERLTERFGVKVDPQLPPVAYRETPSGEVRNVSGVHKRMSDGLVQEFGACAIDLVPQPPSCGNAFEADVEEDHIPGKFLASVDAGVRNAMRRGPTAGYPVVGADVKCIGGDYDMLQSTEDHFRLAAERAGKHALEKAGTRLLEPWWFLEVRVPADDVGTLLAELGSRRARINGLEVDGREATIHAQAPYREVRTFGARLQGLTGGRGRFIGRPSHYDPLPQSLVPEAIAQSPFREPHPAADTVLDPTRSR